MARRPRYWHILQSAKQEACVAIDFHNRVNRERSLEGFLVHMGMAWLLLCQSMLERRGVDYRYWELVGRRRRLVRESDGHPRTWELKRCIRELIPSDRDPVRLNVEFFIPLRNLVEHRWAQSIESVVTGRVQSYVMNFEQMLIAEYGPHEGLSDRLRLPILLSTLTGDAALALRRAHRNLPSRIRRYMADFDAGVPEEVRSDPKYELRLYLLPKKTSRSEADLALEFLRFDELTPEAREALEHAEVIVRDRERPVRGAEDFRASDVVREVQARIPFRFNLHGHHTACWRHYKVRPAGRAAHKRTEDRYCYPDKLHGDYVYTKAWVELLVRELGTEQGFLEVTGKQPVPK